MKTFRLYYSISIFFLIISFLISWSNLSAQDLNPASWSHLKGYWKFQNITNLTKATIGNNLSLVGTHKWVPGPAFGDTAVQIAIGSYYRSFHNCAPNGGGNDSVNRYTLMFDFEVFNFDRWHTFFQTDSTNMNDGECFIRPNTGTNPGCIGTAATVYTPNPITPKKWYRLVISVNLGHFYRYYLNGSLMLDGDTQDINGRFALTPLILFFADNNQEDDTIDIASVAIFDTCLSSADIARIGSIDPCVANPPVVNLGADTSLCDYNSLIKNAGTNYKKYLWSTGDTMASVTINKTKLGLGQHNVWAKVIDINGCTAADTAVVTYLASPVVNLGSYMTLCQGRSINLDAGSDTTYQYLWKYLPSGVTLSTLNNITVDSAGKYVAIVTSAFGCATNDTIEIALFANPPKPSISVTGPTSFCFGDSVILKAPSGYLLCHWQDGAGNETRIIKNSGWYKVFVTDYRLCTSVFSDSVAITAYANSAKPVISYTGKTEFCEGEGIVLNVPIGFVEYRWQDGPGNAQRTEKQSGLFYVYVVDSNNCISPVSDTVTIKMNMNPAKPVITIIGGSSVCEGDTIILKAPPGYSAYLWSTSEITKEIYVTTTKKVTLIVTDINNCSSPRADSVTLEVNPNPSRPVIKFLGDSTVCEGESIILSAPAGFPAYLWSTSDITQTIYVTTTQKVSLIVTNSNGCKSPASDTVSAIVHPKPPIPAISKISDTELYCSVKGVNYKWFVSHSPTQSKSVFPQITRTISGLWPKYYYYVVVIDSFGCMSDTSLGYYHDPAGIKDNADQKPVIYPNPANTIVVISMKNLEGAGNIFISITDINGKTVSETKTSFTEIRSGTSLNMQKLNQGIYLVKVITTDRIFTGRIQKM